MQKIRLFETIFLLGFAFVINYFINFFLTSFITENFGVAEYGFVALAKTIASYVIIITTALDSYASRYISIEYHKNNINLANQYFNTVLFSDTFIGCIIIFLSIGFIGTINVFLNIQVVILTDVKFLFLCVFINLFISLVSTAFQSSAIIKDKLRESSFFKLISYIAEAITLMVLYNLATPKLYYIGVGLIISSLIILISSCYITKKYTPNLIVNKGSFKLSIVKKLLSQGIWNSLNNLGNMLNSGLDLFVTNIMLGSVAMGQVSVVKTMTSIFSCIYVIINQPFQPSLLKDYASGNLEKLIKDLKTSVVYSGFFSNLFFACIVGYGFEYYKLWVPSQDSDLLYKLTIIATATSILEGAVYPLYYIYTLTVKNKFPCIITIIGGIFNVISMCFLIPYFQNGIYIVFLTTALIMLVINGITNPIYMARCLKINILSFYPILFRHIISCTLMTASIKFLSDKLIIDSWTIFIAWSAFCFLLGFCIHILIMSPTESLKKFKNLPKFLR